MNADVEPLDPEANVYDAAEVERIREQEQVPMDFAEQEQLAATLREGLEQQQKAREQAPEKMDIEEEEVVAMEEEVEEEVCVPVAKPPVVCGPNEFICETCGKAIPKASEMIHTARCARNFIRCRVCKKGIQRQEKDFHMNRFHNEVACKCGQKFQGTLNMEKHQQTECPFRLVKCKYCESLVEAKDLEAHLEMCGNIQIQCFDCGAFYPRKDSTTHVCTAMCIQCGDRVPIDRLLLHKVTTCMGRRALCKY